MELRLADLRCREVINMADGARLGYVSDVVIDAAEGRVLALIVPGPARFFGLFGREDDYILPWDCVSRMGGDILLIDGTRELRRGRWEGRRTRQTL